MTAGETPLAMVSRHMTEGEGHITRQLAIIDRLQKTQAPSEGSEALLVEAEAMLEQFRTTQSAHVAHLHQIRDDQDAGLRDHDGNLASYEPARYEFGSAGPSGVNSVAPMGQEMKAGALEGCRILVVEDEYFIAVDIAEKLAAEGAFVIGPVATAEEALMLLDEGAPPDAGVLDLNLSGEMTFAVADALVKRGIPFVFATSYAKGDTPPRYADVSHCKKPINAATIARALSR